jgi:hypothetical protein
LDIHAAQRLRAVDRLYLATRPDALGATDPSAASIELDPSSPRALALMSTVRSDAFRQAEKMFDNMPFLRVCNGFARKEISFLKSVSQEIYNQRNKKKSDVEGGAAAAVEGPRPVPTVELPAPRMDPLLLKGARAVGEARASIAELDELIRRCRSGVI